MFYCSKTKAIQMESFIAEFLMHLYCTSFVFRPETVKNYKSSADIAKVAARAMTIFKHFTETRGSKVLLLDDFQKYKVLYKIAFPPTHPAFAHLFKMDWVENTRDRIVAFLHQFYEIDVSVPPPPLLQMFLDRQQQAKAQKTAFKKRERKLMQFARSLYDLSSELTDKLDAEVASSSYDSILGLQKKRDTRSTFASGATADADGRPVLVSSADFLKDVRMRLADYRAVLDPNGGGRSRDTSPSRWISQDPASGSGPSSNDVSACNSEYPSPTTRKKTPAPDPAPADISPPVEAPSSRQGSRPRSRASSAVARARAEEEAAAAAAAAAVSEPAPTKVELENSTEAHPEAVPEGDVGGAHPEAVPDGDVGGAHPEAVPDGDVGGAEPEAVPEGDVGGAQPEAVPGGDVGGAEPEAVPGGDVGGAQPEAVPDGDVGGAQPEAVPDGDVGGAQPEAVPDGDVGGAQPEAVPDGDVGGAEPEAVPGGDVGGVGGK